MEFVHIKKGRAKLNHVRHSGIYDASLLSVTLIGAGGIGATTALTLAKMGVRQFEIWDGDTVSEENIATQLHKPAQIGVGKVYALAHTLGEFSDEIIRLDKFMGRVDEHSTICDQIVISAVDSITARQDIWKAVVRGGFEWYLDARMAAEEFQLHIVDARDPTWYDKLITGEREEDVPDEVCTMKATYFCSQIASGLIGSTVRKIVTGLPVPHKIVFNIRNSVYLEL
jgi:molybdopterin/thiamine biosynthesis adenylyltransferase